MEVRANIKVNVRYYVKDWFSLLLELEIVIGLWLGLGFGLGLRLVLGLLKS